MLNTPWCPPGSAQGKERPETANRIVSAGLARLNGSRRKNLRLALPLINRFGRFASKVTSATMTGGPREIDYLILTQRWLFRRLTRS